MHIRLPLENATCEKVNSLPSISFLLQNLVISIKLSSKVCEPTEKADGAV
jgi:hypothetical protein